MEPISTVTTHLSKEGGALFRALCFYLKPTFTVVVVFIACSVVDLEEVDQLAQVDFEKKTSLSSLSVLCSKHDKFKQNCELESGLLSQCTKSEGLKFQSAPLQNGLVT